MRGFAIAVLAGLALLGCRNEAASLRFPGPDHALTLSVRQPWPWSKELELEAVMQRLPDCHRRSRLEAAAPAEVKVDLYQPPEDVFEEPILILKQGARHYALSTRNCEVQRFKAAPKALGSRLGSFDMAGGKLRYLAAPPPRQMVAAQPPAPATPVPAAASPPAPAAH
jgi:hypothetical protein